MLEIHERSNYLKGLMLLLKKDRVIEEPEKELMKGVGKILGFEKEFIQSSIEDLLENDYITDEIPVFSNKNITESFLLDGLKISFSDNDFAPEEVEYLSQVAQKNGLEPDIFSSMLKSYLSHFETLNDKSFLFIEKYLDEDYREPV